MNAPLRFKTLGSVIHTRTLPMVLSIAGDEQEIELTVRYVINPCSLERFDEPETPARAEVLSIRTPNGTNIDWLFDEKRIQSIEEELL